MKEKSFNRVLVETVDDVIRSLLGEAVASVVLYHLEKDFSLRIEDVPERPDRFEYAMKDLFREGASIIEELYRRIGLNYVRVRGYSFADYIKEAKKSMCGSSKKKR